MRKAHNDSMGENIESDGDQIPSHQLLIHEYERRASMKAEREEQEAKKIAQIKRKSKESGLTHQLTDSWIA